MIARFGRWLGGFLELRLRAFVYALFALNGFILGMIVHDSMTRVGIHQFEEAVKAAVVRKYGA